MIGANTTALMGFGMQGELADLVGADYSLLVGKGTAQTGAAIILSDNVELNVSVGQTAVVVASLATPQQQIAEPIYFVNTSATATAALVFVPSGHTLNGSLNGSVSVAQFKTAVLYQYKNKFWASIVSA